MWSGHTILSSLINWTLHVQRYPLSDFSTIKEKQSQSQLFSQWNNHCFFRILPSEKRRRLLPWLWNTRSCRTVRSWFCLMLDFCSRSVDCDLVIYQMCCFSPLSCSCIFSFFIFFFQKSKTPLSPKASPWLRRGAFGLLPNPRLWHGKWAVSWFCFDASSRPSAVRWGCRPPRLHSWRGGRGRWALVPRPPPQSAVGASRRVCAGANHLCL